MRNLNIKGFTLIELIIVIAIIGALSVAGIPNYIEWSKDRKVRKVNEQIAGLITRLNTQTQRGVFPYTQLRITPQIDNSILVTASGKTKKSILKGLSESPQILLTCDMYKDTYWDKTLSTFTLENIFVHVQNKSGVCFSKNADNYKTKGDIKKNTALYTDDKVEIKNYLIFCHTSNNCGLKPKTPAYMVVWSRFGNVTKFKYNSSGEWIRQ
mgnify:CR=1 FL=1